MRFLTHLKLHIFIPFHFTEQKGQFDREVRARLPNGLTCASSGDGWTEGRELFLAV